MSLSMYSASVPVFVRLLGNMDRWFDKALAHAEAKKFDPSVYVNARLAPDMFPLSRQVQIASDAAKGCVARLVGMEIPSFPDDEKTIDELRQRIRKTIDFIQSVPEAQFEGAETREIVIPLRNREPLQFKGEDYLRFFALPNFYFHLTTTYALLRHLGVEVGKMDYLGQN